MSQTETSGSRRQTRTRRSMKGGGSDQDRDTDLSVVLKGALASQGVSDPFLSGGDGRNLYTSTTPGSSFSIIPPPVNVALLLRMPNDNSILRQCIEAMVINVEGHGHRLEYVGPDGEDQSDAAVTEEANIENLLDTICMDMSITEMRKRCRWDLETLGFAFIEIGRDRQGQPTFLSHIPANTMRPTALDPELVDVEINAVRNGQSFKTKAKRRFRRFVQIVGEKKVWFKEWNDPRLINPDNGKEEKINHENSATEIIYLRQYYPGQLYGLPRWFNNVVAIQGARQAELTNLDYFKENAIPALAVLVSGGYINDTTMEEVEEHLTAARGRAAQNRIVVIEAYGDEHAAADSGTIPLPKVEIKPLAGERPKEGMFLAYDKAQTEKVRSSFRLPPIFTGHAQDYSHASAKTSYEVAEGQVFGPERAYMDDVINRAILHPFGFKFWQMRSNPPKISDPQEVLNAVNAFNAVGSMTPNVGIGLANEAFGLDIPLIADDWGNWPFQIVQALANQGKLIGVEAIMKEVDNAVDVAGDPNDPNDPNADPDADPNSDNQDGQATKNLQKAARGVLRDFRSILDTATSMRYVARER
jgi:PBSX family phage portal protein